MSDIGDALEKLRAVFLEIDNENTKREEAVWESLDEATQLDVFCAVVRRLVQGEIVDGQSYRGVLYDTFGFGLDAYVRAQMAGFLQLHNSIVTDEERANLIKDFVQKNDISISEADINNYLMKRSYW